MVTQNMLCKGEGKQAFFYVKLILLSIVTNALGPGHKSLIEISGHIFSDFFSRFKESKRLYFIVALPLPTPPPLLVAGPLKKERFLRLS